LITEGDLNIPLGELAEFENSITPQDLMASKIPVKILGYGEISTVLDIALDEELSLAYKRMPLFHTQAEVAQFRELYEEYVKLLDTRIGIAVVPGELVTVTNLQSGKDVVYIVQEKLPPESIGHKAIHHLPEAEVHRLVNSVIEKLKKAFDFNKDDQDGLAIGMDGQISNWGIVNFDPDANKLPDEIELLYFDTSTPLMRKDDVEQLDPELFLRSAPSFLTWVLRMFFLDDVMSRYYDFRSVCIDLMANMYKEQRPDLVPGLITLLNEFFSTEINSGEFEPFSEKEIRSYYREDAFIWRIYLAFRRVDQALHHWTGRAYPYILPGRIER
jgi:hypothetical protein